MEYFFLKVFQVFGAGYFFPCIGILEDKITKSKIFLDKLPELVIQFFRVFVNKSHLQYLGFWTVLRF